MSSGKGGEHGSGLSCVEAARGLLLAFLLPESPTSESLPRLPLGNGLGES